MYLLILESIGTQELILVGMIALIVFGPRKLPQMMRKAGSMMRELRSVSDDFKSTWASEVRAAENDIKELTDVSELKDMASDMTNGETPKPDNVIAPESSILPEVREVSEEDFKKLVEEKKKISKVDVTEADKETWL